jgi:methylenetetrahydrofolate/methylenetetrahydromethanopterin dehydrogenase (NADP+)
MKKLLLQVDTDPLASPFDTIAAYDAEVDVVVPYPSITPATVKEVATGAIFARGGEGWKHTAIFIGGRDVALGEQVLAEVKRTFFGPFRVSLLLDSGGCNTTAAAAVAKITAALPLAGERVVVTGTGPVGLRVAGLLAKAGAKVTLTTIREDWLELGLEQVRTRTGLDFQGAVVANGDVTGWQKVLQGAVLLFGATAAGVQVVPKAAWQATASLKVIADLNLVPPAGIEGVENPDNLTERESKRFLGPIGVGNFKMKVQRAAIGALFAENTRVLDIDEVYAVAQKLL